MLTDLLLTGTKEVLQEILKHPIISGSMKTRKKQIVCESVFSHIETEIYRQNGNRQLKRSYCPHQRGWFKLLIPIIQTYFIQEHHEQGRKFFRKNRDGEKKNRQCADRIRYQLE